MSDGKELGEVVVTDEYVALYSDPEQAHAQEEAERLLGPHVSAPRTLVEVSPRRYDG